jgi:hypothetical protein
LGADIAQIDRQTAAVGVEFMDSALNALIVVLTSIRDQADSALRKIDKPRRERSLAWKCTACGHLKHFTRPALAEVAAPCPKCGGTTFIPI